MAILAILAILAIGMGSWGGAWAEGASGVLRGTVEDAGTGERLPGVNIVLLGTVLGTTSDRDGTFRLPNVAPGIYAVEASMMGYRSHLVMDVRIATGRETSLAFVLREAVIEMAPIVVTASKRRQRLQDSPISIGVIGTTELEQEQVVSLDQALRRVPGVDLKKGEIGIRASTGYSQGAGSRVLLLIDGNPAIAGDTGGINWDAIPVAEIESVEIVKGAGSALYGSSALSGVINVITRAPTEVPETRVRVSAGLYNEPYYREWKWTDRRLTFNGVDLSHSRKWGKMGLLISGGRKSSDGYRQNGDYVRCHLLGKLRYDLSPRSTLTLFSTWAEEERGQFLQWKSQQAALEAMENTLGDRVYSAKRNVHASFRQGLHPELAYILKGSFYGTHWNTTSQERSEHAKAGRWGGELRVEWLPSKRHALTMGVEGTYDGVASDIFGDHHTGDLAGYVQDEIKVLPRLTATLGVRYDHHTVDGVSEKSQISPKMGWVVRPGETTSLRASMGKGFRAPSVAERFTSTSAAGIRIVPNPDVKAETAWSYEIGLHQIFGEGLVADVSLFQNEYWELIEPEAVSGSAIFRLANVTRARIRGIETEVKARGWGGFVSGRLSYMYVHPKDLTLGEVLPYRPRHRLLSSLGVNTQVGHLSADVRYLSRAEKVRVYPNDERVAQYVVDLKGSVLLGRITVSAKVENLLEYHYTEVERNLGSIRSFALTLSGNVEHRAQSTTEKR